MARQTAVSFAFDRVLVTGAAGSGKSTLALALAQRQGVEHLDVDAMSWRPTDPPFQQRCTPAERTALFEAATRGIRRWVLSGALLHWADEPKPVFDLVVSLRIPEPIRLARLAAREREHYGGRIDQGGDLHEAHQTFMALARGYESGAAPVNTLANARAWLARQTCPVLEIEGEVPLSDSLATVLRFGER
jgi:adenylate kinase family enzyme